MQQAAFIAYNAIERIHIVYNVIKMGEEVWYAYSVNRSTLGMMRENADFVVKLFINVKFANSKKMGL